MLSVIVNVIIEVFKCIASKIKSSLKRNLLTLKNYSPSNFWLYVLVYAAVWYVQSEIHNTHKSS